MDGLVNEDLLRLWGEKKVRAAIELLEAKSYAQSRFNPKNRYDRTKQYRLVPARLTADLQRRRGTQGGPAGDPPNALGKNAECTESTTYRKSSIRQNCRMEPAEMPDVQTEITYSEITKHVYPSSDSSEGASTVAKEEDGRRLVPSSPERIEVSAVSLIIEWAAVRHVRRRRDDRSYGGPDLHRAVTWRSYCAEKGINDRSAVFQVMDRAKAAADLREQWRYWKYLDEQVQYAAEQYLPQIVEPVKLPQSVMAQPVEDEGSEWAQVKGLIARRVNPVGYANWIKPTAQVGRIHTKLIVWLPDEATRDCLEKKYAEYISEALADLGSLTIEYTRDLPTKSLETDESDSSRPRAS